MEDILTREAFTDRHDIVGSLSAGDQRAEGVQVIIQYAQTGRGEILGQVIGKTDTYASLVPVFDAAAPFMRLEHTVNDPYPRSIQSETVYARSISHKGYPPDYGEGGTYVVSQLRFQDLRITKDHPDLDIKERHLGFGLVGPGTMWSLIIEPEVLSTGERKSKIVNPDLDLGDKSPFEVEIRPWYMREMARSGEYETTANILFLSMRTNKPEDELSDEEFVSQGTVLADDLLLLASLLSRRWITWHKYVLSTRKCQKTYIRRARECTEGELDWHRTLIEPPTSRNCLKTAFVSLRELRDRDLDLKWPIVYYISSNEVKYLEEQFALLFLSLEKLKDMHTSILGMKKTASHGQLKRLKSRVKTAIREVIGTGRSGDLIGHKIGELERPAFQDVLDELLAYYNIQWRDLYPTGSEFTLVRTRNQLFHSSSVVDRDLLLREKSRLRALVERITLTMLGWTNHSRSPADYERAWLSKA